MEVSQAFHRCMRQVLSRPSGCLQSSTIPHTQHLISQTSPRILQPRSTCRAFTSTRPSRVESKASAQGVPPTSQGTSPLTEIGVSASQATNAPAQTGETSREAQIRNEAQSTQPGGSAEQRGASPGPVPVSRFTPRRDNPRSLNISALTGGGAEQRRTPNNYDLYGKGGSVFSNRFGRNTNPTAPTTNNEGGEGAAPRRSGPSLADIIPSRSSTGGSPFDFNISATVPSMLGREKEIPLRLKPTLGRTQNVNYNIGMDLGRAFRTVEMKCNANNVRLDERAQRTHVRAGQRRKLERSRRWRVQFRAGFLAECARVRRMRDQGW